MSETELLESPGVVIDELLESELLREPLQLAARSRALDTIRSTKCVLTRRSEKKRSAFRVSALFLTPKI